MRRIVVGPTLNNQNLSSAVLVYTYTADADREVFFRLFAEQVAGNGVYTAYITLQRAGTGTVFEVQPRTAPTVASGITAIAFTTVAIPVLNTDVVKVYLIGLAGDTTTPDVFAEVWEADYLQPLTDGQHGVNVDSNGKLLLQDGAVTAAVVGTGAIDADALSADAATELFAALLATSITGGTVQTALERALTYLNATISSRSAPGDTMDLVTDAVDANSLATNAITELITALLASSITGGTVQVALERAIAYLNATISSRAVPGDAMDLVDDALDAGTVAASGAAEIAAAVGSGISVTFTQTPAEIAAAVQGSRLTLTRDSDFTARLYVTGGISPTRDDFLITVKAPQQRDAGALDSESIIQWSEVGGLLYLNKAAMTGGDTAEGSLTVVDEMNSDGNGVIDLTLSSAMMAQLAKYSGYAYDGKEIEAGADLQRFEGLLDVVASVTRTISS